MNLQTLTAFNLVALHGGFNQASRASGKPKATLSRHVNALEESLGIRLVERLGRSFRLTEEGRALHNRTGGLLKEVVEVVRELSADQAHPRGRLRVSSPSTFGHAEMGRLCAEYSMGYPGVRLELTVEDRMVDLIEENYDVVIRVNPSPMDELVGHCILRDRTVVVAPPHFSPRPGGGAVPSSVPVAVPAVVGIESEEYDTWVLDDGASHKNILRKAILRLPTPSMVREAVLAGAGIAMLAHDQVAADLAAGRLKCWGTVKDRTLEIWVLHTSRRLTTSRVSSFVQFLRNAYADRTLDGKKVPDNTAFECVDSD